MQFYQTSLAGTSLHYIILLSIFDCSNRSERCVFMVDCTPTIASLVKYWSQLDAWGYLERLDQDSHMQRAFWTMPPFNPMCMMSLSTLKKVNELTPFEFSMNCTMHFPNVHSSGSEEACLSCGSLPLSLSQWWTCGIMILFFLISWLRSKPIFVLYLWHNAHLYVQVCFKTQKYKQEAVTRVSDIPEAC